MEFLAELLFELFGEVIIDTGVDAASDHRRPKWLRVLILTVLGLLCAVVFAVLLLVGIGAVRDLPLISLFLFALDAVWVFLSIHKFRKILRTFSLK